MWLNDGKINTNDMRFPASLPLFPHTILSCNFESGRLKTLKPVKEGHTGAGNQGLNDAGVFDKILETA